MAPKPRLSEAHLHRQCELHENGPPKSKSGKYGISGHKWALPVMDMALNHGCRTILDYGAGAQMLEKEIAKLMPSLVVSSYDPVTAPLTPLDPADMVTCTDVLEQVELDYIGAIVDDIGTLARKALFIVIAMHPTSKYYHGLLIRPLPWWTKIVDDILSSRFHLKYSSHGPARGTKRLIIRGLKQ